MPTAWLSFAEDKTFEVDAWKAVKFSDEASAIAVRDLVDPDQKLLVTEHIFDSQTAGIHKDFQVRRNRVTDLIKDFRKGTKGRSG